MRYGVSSYIIRLTTYTPVDSHAVQTVDEE